MELTRLQELEQRLFAHRVATRSDAASEMHTLFGESALPNLIAQFGELPRWNQRAAVVSYAIEYTQVSDAAMDLMRAALQDRSSKVRALALEGYGHALREDTLAELHTFLATAVDSDAEFVRRAIDTIKSQDVPSVIVPELESFEITVPPTAPRVSTTLPAPRIGLRSWLQIKIDEARRVIYG